MKNNKGKMQDIKWDADYDGDVANVQLEITDNNKNKKVKIELTNEDIADMLNVDVVNTDINERLLHDFKKKKKHVRFEKLLRRYKNTDFKPKTNNRIKLYRVTKRKPRQHRYAHYDTLKYMGKEGKSSRKNKSHSKKDKKKSKGKSLKIKTSSAKASNIKENHGIAARCTVVM
jgi:hypothetical protein